MSNTTAFKKNKVTFVCYMDDFLSNPDNNTQKKPLSKSKRVGACAICQSLDYFFTQTNIVKCRTGQMDHWPLFLEAEKRLDTMISNSSACKVLLVLDQSCYLRKGFKGSFRFITIWVLFLSSWTSFSIKYDNAVLLSYFQNCLGSVGNMKTLLQ